MIVLDEQLLGRNLQEEIAHWYRNSVRFVTDLRPGTVIKDDAIPVLLRKESQPTFVTINAKDFWMKVEIDERFCLICFDWPDSKAALISESLRDLFQRAEFSTKHARMGKVIRVSETNVCYYTWKRSETIEISSLSD